MPKSALTLASITLFLCSLPFDSFYVDGKSSAIVSWKVLAIGWVGAAGQPSTFAWFANPILALTWLFLGADLRRAALLSSVAAFCLAAGFLATRAVMENIESGAPSPVTGYGLGYWLWLGSVLCAVLQAYLAWQFRFDQADPRPTEN
jgi:hypothetical protein